MTPRDAFLDDASGSAYRGLRIIDLETGDQPIFNEDGSVVVVLNDEIYNLHEHRAAAWRTQAIEDIVHRA